MMLIITRYRTIYLQKTQKAVPLHCGFHSIRFKVNKRLGQGVDPFFLPIPLIVFYPPILNIKRVNARS